MHGDFGLIKTATYTFLTLGVIVLFFPEIQGLALILFVIGVMGLGHLETCWMCDGR